jgi:hypothetical protein
MKIAQSLAPCFLERRGSGGAERSATMLLVTPIAAGPAPIVAAGATASGNVLIATADHLCLYGNSGGAQPVELWCRPFKSLLEHAHPGAGQSLVGREGWTLLHAAPLPAHGHKELFLVVTASDVGGGCWAAALMEAQPDGSLQLLNSCLKEEQQEQQESRCWRPVFSNVATCGGGVWLLAASLQQGSVHLLRVERTPSAWGLSLAATSLGKLLTAEPGEQVAECPKLTAKHPHCSAVPDTQLSPCPCKLSCAVCCRGGAGGGGAGPRACQPVPGHQLPALCDQLHLTLLGRHRFSQACGVHGGGGGYSHPGALLLVHRVRGFLLYLTRQGARL